MPYIKKNKIDEFVWTELHKMTKQRVDHSLSENKSIDEILDDVTLTVTSFLNDIAYTLGSIATVTDHVESWFLTKMKDTAVLHVMSKKCKPE